jgi:TPR repeat protein
MYETGNGVDKDIGMAKKLYADSAASGMEEAAARLKALGGEPPPLRSTSEDTAGPSRESLPPGSQPPEAAQTSPAAEPAPEPAPAADDTPKDDKPKSADDYQDISTPNFTAPDDSPDARDAPDLEPSGDAH